MRARGFITALGAALGAALAGASIGLAAPGNAAPEGPDSVEQQAGDSPTPAGVIVVEQPGAAAVERARMSGVVPGLAPLRLLGDSLVVGLG